MTTVVAIALLWVAFAGTHIVLSSATVRPRLVNALGLQGFLGLYSIVALATFTALAWTFATHKHAGPLLWVTLGPPGVARVANYALMLIAFAFVVCSVVPSWSAPSGMQASGPPQARGLIRITRHPMLVAFALFGVAHLFVNGSLGDVVFFAGFPLYAWLGARHQDSRKVEEVPGYAEVVRTTSFVPFAAILAGRQRLVARELPLVWLTTGVVLAIVLRQYHGVLFGP